MESMKNSAAYLREYLSDARDAVVWKCEGLTEAQARQPMTATGTHAMGLLLHLAVTESEYFITCLGEEVHSPLIRDIIGSNDEQASFLPPSDLTLNEVIQIYRETVAVADKILDRHELTSPVVVPWWVKNRHTTVERLLIHMIAESHRHAGHLDIVRELLDGFIGLRPAAPNIPGLTPEQWQEQHRLIQVLANEA